MFKAVAFDMDGVLVDTERLANACWLQAGEDLGDKRVTREKVFSVVGLSRADAIATMTRQLDNDVEFAEKLIARRDELYFAKLAVEVPKKPFAQECLAALKECGYTLLLVTSTFREFAMVRVESTGLYPYFDYTIFGDMVTKRKPDPMIYNMAAEVCGYRPEEIVAIEDSIVGVAAAKNAGFNCIMVPDLIAPSDDMPRQPDYICKDLAQVAKMLVEQRGNNN